MFDVFKTAKRFCCLKWKECGSVFFTGHHSCTWESWQLHLCCSVFGCEVCSLWRIFEVRNFRYCGFSAHWESIRNVATEFLFPTAVHLSSEKFWKLVNLVNSLLDISFKHWTDVGSSLSGNVWQTPGADHRGPLWYQSMKLNISAQIKIYT